jgi:hypothetical protein
MGGKGRRDVTHRSYNEYIPAGFILTITSIYIFLPVHILSQCVFLITGCLVSIKREEEEKKKWEQSINIGA